MQKCSYLCEFNDDQKSHVYSKTSQILIVNNNVAILDNNYSFHANCNFLKQKHTSLIFYSNLLLLLPFISVCLNLLFLITGLHNNTLPHP